MDMRFAKFDGEPNLVFGYLVQIAKSYALSQESLESAKKVYLRDLEEIGTNRIYFISFDGEASPLAYVQLVLKNADNDPSLANGNDIAHIHDLRVRMSARKQGNGQKLMQFLETNAQELGVLKLTLGVDDWNEEALNLYRKLGYSKFKEEPGRTGDERLLCMSKSIRR